LPTLARGERKFLSTEEKNWLPPRWNGKKGGQKKPKVRGKLFGNLMGGDTLPSSSWKEKKEALRPRLRQGGKKWGV